MLLPVLDRACVLAAAIAYMRPSLSTTEVVSTHDGCDEENLNKQEVISVRPRFRYHNC